MLYLACCVKNATFEGFPWEAYSSDRIRKAQNEHLIIVFQNLIGHEFKPISYFLVFILVGYWSKTCWNKLNHPLIVIFEKKPFQFWREIWIHVLVILSQLYYFHYIDLNGSLQVQSFTYFFIQNAIFDEVFCRTFWGWNVLTTLLKRTKIILKA